MFILYVNYLKIMYMNIYICVYIHTPRTPGPPSLAAAHFKAAFQPYKFFASWQFAAGLHVPLWNVPACIVHLQSSQDEPSCL